MGLRHRDFFLHDGRVTRIMDAILAHGGEAEGVGGLVLSSSDRLQAASDVLREIGGGEQREAEARGGELLDLGNMSLSELEERAILAALERTDGNKVEASRRLGITRQTLYNKLKSLGIEVRRNVRRAD